LEASFCPHTHTHTHTHRGVGGQLPPARCVRATKKQGVTNIIAERWIQQTVAGLMRGERGKAQSSLKKKKVKMQRGLNQGTLAPSQRGSSYVFFF
jgi:hypothetical protein